MLPKKLHDLDLYNTFIIVEFDTCLSCPFHGFIQVEVMSLVTAKYLDVICYPNSSLALLIRLVYLLLKNILGHF